MSVGFVTMGKFAPPAGDPSGGDTAPYAHGGGVYPGALPEPRPRLSITATFLEVNRIDNEKKFEISPIKVNL